MSRLSVALVLLFGSLTACTSGGTTDPCGGCGTGQYCCLTRCQPLGTTCGGGDAGAPRDDARIPDAALDAAVPPLDGSAADAGNVDSSMPGPDASVDPCAPRAGATSVASACEASDPGLVAAGYPGAAVLTCGTHTASWCGHVDSCVEWIDSAGASHGVCTDTAVTATDVCDPAHDTADCVGAVERVCVATTPGAAVGDAPPGWWGHSDCRTWWAADATCVVDPSGAPRCTSPSDVPCNPTTYVTHCNERCVASPGAPMGGALREICGADRPTCISTPATMDVPVCLPAGATPSSLAPTLAEIGVSCVGTDQRHVEEYGYEWTEPCAPVYTGSGGVLTMVPTHCWTSPDAATALCITATEVTCASATVAPHCADGTHSTSCSGWIESTTACAALDGTPTLCDATTGSCVSPPPCHPGWPFTETCAGADHKWISGACTTGIATLAPCAMCRPSSTGSGVDCG